jgi:hypothetical protein
MWSETINIATLTVNPLTQITFQPLSRSNVKVIMKFFAINTTGSDYLPLEKERAYISDDGIIIGLRHRPYPSHLSRSRIIREFYLLVTAIAGSDK